MATSKECFAFVMEQLSEIDGITHRYMMGEYVIYLNGRIAGYVCDDRLLVKPVPGAVRLMPNASYEKLYEGSKEMLLVDNLDDREFLKALFLAMYEELPLPKPKKKKIK